MVGQQLRQLAETQHAAGTDLEQQVRALREQTAALQAQLASGRRQAVTALEALRAENAAMEALRAENIAADGGNRPTQARNYRVLRQIAFDYPPLTRAVWRLLGSEPHVGRLPDLVALRVEIA